LLLRASAIVFSVLLLTPFSSAAMTPEDAPKTLSQKIAGMERKDGLFPLDWDAKTGKLYLEIPQFAVDGTGKDFLLLDQLPYGLGSNDVGLDRGQLGTGRVVHFLHAGGKILLIAPNLNYRSTAQEAAERIAVKESFAESVLWGFKVEAEENGRYLIDASDFFLRDAHNAAESIQQAGQGKYKLEPNRSAITEENTKNFPKNTEVEAILTFVSDGQPKGEYVASVTPDPHAVTLREHTSLIELPDLNAAEAYKPRKYDPRSGFFSQDYRDYSVPLGEPMDQRLLVRHRLEKRDPKAAVSEPVKPIIYYVDRGAPEPIRTALVEGASWWNQAFEAAGFKNAFQVQVLPEGADPMDIRYNMIQWVHRATRGWSYGEAVTDPRTGEILKGQVTLGSLRARQDYKIAEALLSPYVEGKPILPDMKRMVLARIRQLAAHEVGHTLGLQHNFAASSVAPGTSVMDYPHPWITLDSSGKLSLDKAYSTGIGAWDKAVIRYGYTQFAPGTNEAKELNAFLQQNEAAGLRYITDADARPLGGAHPYAHLWDNGPEAPAELERILAVRKAALARFGENAIPPGTPMSELEETLVPLYLLHRYQTEAAAKLIGGVDYRYAVRGATSIETGMVTQMLAPDRQRAALAAVLKTLDPEALTLPADLLASLPPKPPGYPRTRESFEGHTGLTFDPQGAVEAGSSLTASLLFEPERASRLVEYHARDANALGLGELIDETLKATWKAPRLQGLVAQTQFSVEEEVLTHLMSLAVAKEASPQARAEALVGILDLQKWLKSGAGQPQDSPHVIGSLDTIDRFLKDPAKFVTPPGLKTPPGQPIGSDELDEFYAP
jgi:uncharacterized protein DUF4953/uncharacterized protein DUF5117